MDELIDALCIIKIECGSHENCTACRLYDDGLCTCGISCHPHDWTGREDVMSIVNSVCGGN